VFIACLLCTSQSPCVSGQNASGQLRVLLNAMHVLAVHPTGDEFDGAVVDGDGTVSNSDMPFVNRFEELFELFRINAQNMIKAKKVKGDITDFRRFKLLFCVQVSCASDTAEVLSAVPARCSQAAIPLRHAHVPFYHSHTRAPSPAVLWQRQDDARYGIFQAD
jgi:hypothetical protein